MPKEIHPFDGAAETVDIQLQRRMAHTQGFLMGTITGSMGSKVNQIMHNQLIIMNALKTLIRGLRQTNASHFEEYTNAEDTPRI